MESFKDKRYVIFGNPSEYYIQAYKDASDTDFCQYLPYPIDTKNRLLLGLYRLNYSKKINSIIPLPKLPIWRKKAFINHWNSPPDYLIFFNSSVFENYIINGTLDLLKQTYPDAKTIVFCQDLLSANARKINIAHIKKKVDLVLSFDQGDAEKYDLVYYPLVYSNISNTEQQIAYDLSFIGGAKNRLNEIIEVWEYCTSNGIKCDFHIVGVSKDKQIHKGMIHYRRSVPYSEYITRLKRTNCVLEIMQKNGRGSTIRLCESVFFNKKLLTNNADVQNHKVFDYGFIKQFNRVSEIDIDFIKERTVVDYSTIKDLFSPLRLLEYINNYFSVSE